MNRYLGFCKPSDILYHLYRGFVPRILCSYDGILKPVVHLIGVISCSCMQWLISDIWPLVFFIFLPSSVIANTEVIIQDILFCLLNTTVFVIPFQLHSATFSESF